MILIPKPFRSIRSTLCLLRAQSAKLAGVTPLVMDTQVSRKDTSQRWQKPLSRSLKTSSVISLKFRICSPADGAGCSRWRDWPRDTDRYQGSH
jgi:hypothetical protein